MDEGRRPPGRPKVLGDAERRHRILEAAGELFMREGYGSTDMKRVAEHAGMSKRTLYEVFQNKEDLFATLVCDRDGAAHGPSPVVGEGSAETLLAETLYRLAAWVLSPRQIGLTRLVVAEAPRTPDLALRFREQAMDLGRRSITERLAAIGSLASTPDRLDGLASLLYGAVVGDMQLRALAGEDIEAYRDEARLRERIAGIVGLIFVSKISGDAAPPDARHDACPVTSS